jgi:hypothetical protein
MWNRILHDGGHPDMCRSVKLEKLRQTCITDRNSSREAFNLNNILLCIIHNRIRQQAISLYKPSPIRYKV